MKDNYAIPCKVGNDRWKGENDTRKIRINSKAPQLLLGELRRFFHRQNTF